MSYVAAIVWALAPGNRNGADHIAMRMMASADLLPELEGIADGRALNPIKAVSMHEDVVEYERDGRTSLAIGELRQLSKTRIDEFCRRPVTFLNEWTLLKVARDPRSKDKTDLVFYYIDQNGEFRRSKCKLRRTNLDFVENSSGQRTGISTAHIIDFVPRMQ